MTAILEQARALLPELVALRRDLHHHPETAWEEVRTAGVIAEQCRGLGLEVRTGMARTGVIAALNGEKQGPILALRADMDALPITEENDLPFRSAVPGKGHLCGHDAHCAMLVGAAKLLACRKEEIPFPVWFLFQPAEEVPPGGAELLLDEGRLSGVAEIFGLHVAPQLPVGYLILRTGDFMASMDKFSILIEGKGGHGGMPHLTRDPVPVAAETVLALQTLVARRVDPLAAAVVSVCMVEAGSVFNAIPSQARLTGTARSLDKAVRDQLPQWLGEIATGIAAAHGQKATLEYTPGTPVLVNPPEPTERMRQAFRTLGGEVIECPPVMYGEDFAYFLERMPGSFGFLGAGDGTEATAQGFHHAGFAIHEESLAWGAALHAQLVLDRAGRAGAAPGSDAPQVG